MGKISVEDKMRIQTLYEQGMRPKAIITAYPTKGWKLLTEYNKLQSKPKTAAELQTVLQKIWDSLPQDSIDKAVLSFRKRLQACVRANGGHIEHVLT